MTNESERAQPSSVGSKAAALAAGALTAGSVLAVALAALLAGCVLSIEPAIPESESVFEPGLLGTWVSPGGRDTAVITRAGETGYRVLYADDEGERGVFAGRSGQLAGRLILEVTPAHPDSGSGAYWSLLLPGHLLFVVEIVPEGLRTLQLKADSLRAMLGRGDAWMPHLASVGERGDGDGHLVLTGTTAELQQWLGANLDRAGVWGDRTDWRRVRAR